jgi:hypothetical protein
MTMLKTFLLTSLLFATAVAFGQGDTTTTILGLTKPGHLSHVGNWDVVYNTNFDILDSTYPLNSCVRVGWDGTGHKFTCLAAIVEGDVTNLMPDLALKAPLASPAFIGIPSAPTPSPLDNSTSLATTAYDDAAVSIEKVRALAAEVLKAPLASPALTGVPTVPTAAFATSTTQAASTAFVQAALPAVPVQSVAGKTGTVTLVESDVASLLSDLALKAPLASPTFTGTVTTPVVATSGSNGGITGPEGTGASLSSGAGTDLLYPDSTNHCWHSNQNGVDVGCLATATSTTSAGWIFPAFPTDPSAPTSTIASVQNQMECLRFVAPFTMPGYTHLVLQNNASAGVGTHVGFAIYDTTGATRIMTSGAQDGTLGVAFRNMAVSAFTLNVGTPYIMCWTTDSSTPASWQVVGELFLTASIANLMNQNVANKLKGANASVAGAPPTSLGALSSSTGGNTVPYIFIEP